MAEDPVDALFALPPEDFTAARNDLVRELRAAGERERAKEVAGLRRPTVAAWAVNQAIRTDPDAYTALLDAGREVRRAQRRALSGMARSGLREASRARREHIDRLTAAAAHLLRDAGGDPAAHRDDIAATFDAASAGDEAGQQVGAARLERPLEAPSTFGDLAALSVVESEPETEEAADVTGNGGADEAGAGSDEAAEQLRAATAAVAATRRRAEEAAAARRRAREEAEAARRQADAATSEADDAGANAEEAAAEAERARREADRRRREADRLRRRAEGARDAAQRRTDDAADADRAAEELARDVEEAEERVRSLRSVRD